MKKILPVLIALGMATFERRVKRVASGIGLIAASAFFVLIAIVFLLVGMFFGFADIDRLVLPSVITAGVIILIALLTAIQGFRLVKK